MTEEEKEDKQDKTLEEIQKDLHKLIGDIGKLQK